MSPFLQLIWVKNLLYIRTIPKRLSCAYDCKHLFCAETVSQLCQNHCNNFSHNPSNPYLPPLGEIMRNEDKRHCGIIQEGGFDNYVEATHIVFEGEISVITYLVQISDGSYNVYNPMF